MATKTSPRPSPSRPRRRHRILHSNLRPATGAAARSGGSAIAAKTDPTRYAWPRTRHPLARRTGGPGRTEPRREPHRVDDLPPANRVARKRAGTKQFPLIFPIRSARMGGCSESDPGSVSCGIDDAFAK